MDLFREKHTQLPKWHSGKESTCQGRRHKRHSFDPWLRKIPWGRNGNLLQYSCLENPMDRRSQWGAVHRVAKARLSNWAHTRTSQTECGLSQKVRGAPGSGAVSFYSSGSFHRLMSGNISSAILEKGQGFPEAGPPPTFWPLTPGLSAGGCVIEMLIYYGEPKWGSEPLEVDSSVVLDIVGSNQFSSYPMTTSFLPRLCPVPFLPVSVPY